MFLIVKQKILYQVILNLHIISAFFFIGLNLFIALKWKKLSKNKKHILKKVHQFIEIFGWILFLTGFILIYILKGQLLLFNWMKFSIGLFLFIQLFDHFWADKQEIKIKNINDVHLNIWLILKVFFYSFIMFLMYVKPI